MDRGCAKRQAELANTQYQGKGETTALSRGGNSFPVCAVVASEELTCQLPVDRLPGLVACQQGSFPVEWEQEKEAIFMELSDRIALVRKAAGLTQEQLGALVGVTRQAVSKWESGQAVPDAVTAAKLCEALHVSADFVLLGKEPDGVQPPTYTPPDTCPCCGRAVAGSVCTVCGYQLPEHPPRGPRYALVAEIAGYVNKAEEHAAELEKYCGLSMEYAQAAITQSISLYSSMLIRRDLDDGAARYLASVLDRSYFRLRIVQDDGKETGDALLAKPAAMELPPLPKEDGIGFWGVVGAVIVALIILSFL